MSTLKPNTAMTICSSYGARGVREHGVCGKIIEKPLYYQSSADSQAPEHCDPYSKVHRLVESKTGVLLEEFYRGVSA